MPNFSKDKSGFNIENPMDKVEVKGKSSELPGMIGMRSDNPSPNKFLGALGLGKMGKSMLPGKKGNAPAAGGGDLEARVSALEAQAGEGGAGPTDPTGITTQNIMAKAAESQKGGAV